jgi:hypothetical protein
MLLRERDCRIQYSYGWVIFHLCKDYPDGARLYTRILARFTQCCILNSIESEPIEQSDDDMNYYVTRDSW